VPGRELPIARDQRRTEDQARDHVRRCLRSVAGSARALPSRVLVRLRTGADRESAA